MNCCDNCGNGKLISQFLVECNEHKDDEGVSEVHAAYYCCSRWKALEAWRLTPYELQATEVDLAAVQLNQAWEQLSACKTVCREVRDVALKCGCQPVADLLKPERINHRMAEVLAGRPLTENGFVLSEPSKGLSVFDRAVITAGVVVMCLMASRIHWLLSITIALGFAGWCLMLAAGNAERRAEELQQDRPADGPDRERFDFIDQ